MLFGHFLKKISTVRKNKIVVVDDLHPRGGADYPIIRYIDYKESEAERIHVIYFKRKWGFFYLVATILIGKKILINGIRAFNYWEAFLFFLFKKKIAIYLHETNWVFSVYKTNHPIKFHLLIRILRNNKVLCVSKLQQQYLKAAFDIDNTYLVYNTIGSRRLLSVSEGSLNIFMIGSIQERKGVNLFSELADYCNPKHPDWSFHWVGGGGFDDSNLYLSGKVNWYGHIDAVMINEYLKQCDIFFLSSIDDPFPLTCMEALYHNKKCIVYKNTGTAEIICDIEGCAVYSDYCVESAYQALCNVISVEINREKASKVYETISSVGAFAQRVDEAFKNLYNN